MDELTIAFKIESPPSWLPIGRTAENNWRAVEIDCSYWFNMNANGEVVLMYKPSCGMSPYPLLTERDGDNIVWRPKSGELVEGVGRLQAFFEVGTDVIGSSDMISCEVDSSLLGVDPGTDPGQTDLPWALDIIEQIAELSGHYPKIENGVLYVWDSEQEDWVQFQGGGGNPNAVLYTPQSLTDSQKAQARTNVGAGTYSKPASGIPASDLASAVQTSLGKADTALQSHQSLAAYRTASAQDTIDASKANSADLATVAFSGDYNDLLNRPDEGYIFADEIPQDADHSAKYVLPDGYIYVYGEHTYHRTHNANTGLVNIKPDTNANYQSLSSQSGVLTSDLIPFSADWVPSTADRANSTIKVSGLEKLVPAYSNSSIIVYLYYADGSWMGAARTSQIFSLGSPALGSEISLPVEWYLKDTNSAGVVGSWSNVGYVRVLIGVSTSGSITADDVADVIINVPYYDTDVTATEWYNTGERYVADPQVQQNTEDIASLKTRMSGAEGNISTLSDSLENRTFDNVNTGQILYAVGDSITYGYGVGGNSGSWVRHVIDRNGYDAANSRNLGESGLGFCTASTSSHTVQDIVGGTDFSGADIVTVALGINDWKNYNALLTDVWSGMEYVFGKIRTDNPYCKIYFIVPFNVSIGTSAYATFYGLGYAGDNNPLRPYAHTLLEFIGMLKERFALSPLNAYNVQIIDLTEGVAINRQNITTALIDNLHPTAETHIELGKEIAPILRFNNHYGQTAAQVQSAIGAIQAWQGGSY